MKQREYADPVLLQEQAKSIYLLLAALFITALVATNLIASKFVTVDLGFATFVISAGVIPYPLTFLITDILSEIYGQKRTDQVVYIGFLCSAFVVFILWLALKLPAAPGSPIDQETFATVFQSSWRILAASMVAYLAAQLVDVRLFHFWKRLTKGKHLWLRNNGSTIISQLVDTTLVLFIFFVGVKPVGEIVGLIGDGWSYKVLFAFADTLLIYPAVAWVRSVLNLKFGEEVVI